jgi:hypothetical protein
MNSKKIWLHYPLAILTLAAIIVSISIHDVLAKFVKRLVPQSRTGVQKMYSLRKLS